MIFDVGANVGMSVRRYLELFPHATIHSFEPFPDSYERLVTATAANPHVHAHRLALAEANGERTFYVNAAFTATNSLLQRPSEGKKYYPHGAELHDKLKVSSWTLDDFCAHNDIHHIDLLKLDVQGGELLVLRGATRFLEQKAIDVILTEVMFVPHYEGAPLFLSLAAHLEDHGYTFFNFYDYVVGSNGQLCQSDAIFVSPKIRESVVNDLRLPERATLFGR